MAKGMKSGSAELLLTRGFPAGRLPSGAFPARGLLSRFPLCLWPRPVAVVDGSTVESGDAVVAHIKKHFGANATIQHLILTHPVGDHASGIRSVLDGLKVANLWMHIPWLHAQDALPYFAKKDWTVEPLTAAIKKEYDLLDDIVTTALAKNVTIHGAFQGDQIGPFTVLSLPSVSPLLMAQFDRAPDPDQRP